MQYQVQIYCHKKKKMQNKNDKDHLPSIILCDIDNFKTINDTFGHQVGDECLKELAVELKKSFTEEHVYRFGGDEFVIISNLNEEEIIYRLKKINETLLYILFLIIDL